MHKSVCCFRVCLHKNLGIVLPQRVLTQPKNIFTKSITKNSIYWLNFRKQHFSSLCQKSTTWRRSPNQKLFHQTNHCRFSLQRKNFSHTMPKSNRVLLPTGKIILVTLIDCLDVQPKKYKLTLEPDLQKFTFSGKESVEFKVNKPTKT